LREGFLNFNNYYVMEGYEFCIPRVASQSGADFVASAAKVSLVTPQLSQHGHAAHPFPSCARKMSAAARIESGRVKVALPTAKSSHIFSWASRAVCGKEPCNESCC
jgi:hypothetical protein